MRLHCLILTALLCVVLLPVLGLAETPRMVDFVLHDDDPRVDCDALHGLLPGGWAMKGRVTWGLTGLSPVKDYICIANPAGPELWASYPVQAFVWRDNFNIFGLQFPLKLGDPDPMVGEEIERPIPDAAQCMQQVILPRFRKDLVNAQVVSVKNYTPQEALDLAKRIAPGEDTADNPQIQITHSAALARFEYPLNGKTLQEDMLCIVYYADLPTANLGVLHVWQINSTTSFRAEKGSLDAETADIADKIRASIRVDPQWPAKAAAVQKQIVQAFAERINEYAQARMSDIRQQASNAIFQMSQDSYHRRMTMMSQQGHDFSNAINGQDDYRTPSGSIITAPLAPMGQNAWLGSDGKTYNFAAGTNPNGSSEHPGLSFQELSPK